MHLSNSSIATKQKMFFSFLLLRSPSSSDYFFPTNKNRIKKKKVSMLSPCKERHVICLTLFLEKDGQEDLQEWLFLSQ